MAQAKVELMVGKVSFSGEGEETWLAEQIDKIIDAATTLSSVAALDEDADSDDEQANGVVEPGAPPNNPAFQVSLVSHIRAKKGESNQLQRFLVTADWLRQRGSSALTTGNVAKALLDNQQKRLANPADCLNKNVGKGFCEKTKTGFFITPEGLKHLGYS
jgi:hypothetical protein